MAALLAMMGWSRLSTASPGRRLLPLLRCVDPHLSEVVDVPYPLVSALIPLDVFERV